jgi:hypothetical protein
VVWVVLLTAWVPATAGLAASKASTTVFLVIVTPLAVLSMISMLAFGAKLGRRAMWRELGLACLAGTAAFLGWYGAITIAAPDPTGQNDHVAGIGTVILAVPVLAFVGVMVGLGGLAGWASRRRPTAHADPPTRGAGST